MRALALAALLLAAACAPREMTPLPPQGPPRLVSDAYIAADGTRHPMAAWRPEGEPRAVVLALHGFNDRAQAFERPAAFWRDQGIATYAYDQQGFGVTAGRGLWPGEARLIADLRTATALLRARHPGVPLFVLGESMGGAVVIAAAAEGPGTGADGEILVAPAVWGRSTMPWSFRATLWLTAHTVPGIQLTPRGLEIMPTDNPEALAELANDPRVIKRTRVDAVWGLVGLMDRALADSARLDGPLLVLYGERDDIVPDLSVMQMLERLPEKGSAHRRVAVYPGGFHMLLRDLEAKRVWRDVAAWIDMRTGRLPADAALPSGAEYAMGE